MKSALLIDFCSENPKLAIIGKGIKVFSSKTNDGVKLLSKITSKSLKAKIGKIIVVRGPGSFSAVRRGVVSGNMLSFLLCAKLVGLIKKEGEALNELIIRGMKEKEDLAELTPHYYAPPNITFPKTKNPAIHF